MSTFPGANWVKKDLRIESMSPLGEKVADVLGDVWRGIYHLPLKSLRRVDWNHAEYMEICVYGGLSTFDYDDLTRLVVLCHDRAVRLEIRGATPKYLRLCFSPRQREGDTYNRHPTIEAAIESIRKAYVPDAPQAAAGPGAK